MGGNMDFSLKPSIVEINRDADRRYQFATMKIRTLEREGKKFPQSSPLLEKWGLMGNSTEAHAQIVETFDFMKACSEDKDCPDQAKAYIKEWLAESPPAMGENIELAIPQVLVEQIAYLRSVLKAEMEMMVEKEGEEKAKAWEKDNLKEVEAMVMSDLINNYVSARDEVQTDADNLKNFFKLQKEMPGKTKADVLKDLWAELPKYSEKPVPPLDEEMLAELALEPATEPGEFRHSWGIADKLYKSEAIDAFGAKYLLGIYETKEQAQKAFDDWNAEYEKARETSIEEMKQWSKQEQARIDNDVEGQERIKKVLEEARR